MPKVVAIMELSDSHPDLLKRYLENWQNEVDSAAQYRTLERFESDSSRARIFAGLAAVEEKHIGFWESQLAKLGAEIPAQRPSWRSRVLMFLAKNIGANSVLPTIRRQESAGLNSYANQPETRVNDMAGEERQHAQTLRRMNALAPSGVEGSFIARIEGRHRSVGGNALRASVLGVNDGLCSNLSLIMGVVGLSSNLHAVLLTGIAGLFAGACSMALGEWISVQNSRELAEREIQIEADELAADPESEKEELKLIYEGKGLAEKDARELAEKMISDPARALDALTREELGIDPDERGGNPHEAAIYSFVLFSIGALVPIAPFFVFDGNTAVILGVALSGGALFAFGAITTVFTGQPAFKAGFRQMMMGLAAAGLTFGLGRALGLSLN